MNYYDKALDFTNLLSALRRCCRNVRWKDSVVNYEHNAILNTYKLRQELIKGNYQLRPYQRFSIHEPKEREIVATRLRDRQIQMSLCMAGLYTDITEHFTADNCACQIGRGTDYALNRIKRHLMRYYRENGAEGYVLKCDIQHFFPSTPHSVAKAAIRKRVSDKRAADYACMVIDSFGTDGVGMGLGSQISQLVELAVLDDLDHYIKEQMHIKYYVRYMDDFLLIHKSKEYLRKCWMRIAEELHKIGLQLNRKTCIYKLSQGVTFLRWRFLLKTTGRVLMLLDKIKTGKQRRKIKKMLRKEASGEFYKGTAAKSTECWLSNAAKGHTGRIRRRMKMFFEKEEAKWTLSPN